MQHAIGEAGQALQAEAMGLIDLSSVETQLQSAIGAYMNQVMGTLSTKLATQVGGALQSQISAQLEGESPRTVYRPTKEWVILPLGPSLGVSQLLDADGQVRILGPDQTAEIKGTDLMVSVIRSQLNLP